MSSEKEILALEDKRFAAMIGGDWKTVQGLAHDQLLYTHSSAITHTKATWLESMTSGKTKYKCASFTDRKVRMIGDAALVTGAARPRLTVSRAASGSNSSTFGPRLLRDGSLWHGSPRRGRSELNPLTEAREAPGQ
jgi:hypothetical protein